MVYWITVTHAIYIQTPPSIVCCRMNRHIEILICNTEYIYTGKCTYLAGQSRHALVSLASLSLLVGGG